MIKKNEKTYPLEEVEKGTLEYFNGDDLATDVWIRKYCLKDDNNYYELTPDDMHWRIAREIARIESKYPNSRSVENIYERLRNFKRIIPQGSPMSGIGNDHQIVSLSNCFVIGNGENSDSYGGILKIDQEMVQLMKRRGGVGHDLSHVRPSGSPVKNSAITSTGVVPFMERYSNSTKEVAQDGRRGALMLSISIEHIDSEKFIDAKLMEGKVTGANISVKLTDEFMKAAINGGNFIQKYPIDSDNPKYIKEIDAQKLWNKIVHNAWKSAEPGILFWDKIISESIPDCYADMGFKTISTNPCVVGDTLIAVADGRNAISIKKLADEGNDVPVYCLDNNGKIVIRTMRNPRITGYNQEIYKITIEGGHSFRVTGNHKFKLKSGEYVKTENLKHGDSLHIMTKTIAGFQEVIKKSNSNSQDYSWLSNSGKGGLILEHRLICNINEKDKNLVVHHKDFNGLNNTPSNLQIMERNEHNTLHTINMFGINNPYHKMNDIWKFNFSSHSGEKNSKFKSNLFNDDIRKHAIVLTRKLGKRFTKKDWQLYAKENNLPQSFSGFRCNELGTIIDLAKWSANKLKIEMVDVDSRLLKTYKLAVSNGYIAEICDNEVLVSKVCEECGKTFKVNYFRREISFCSHACSLKHINKNEIISFKRTNTINNTFLKRGELNRESQQKIYSKLKFNLGRAPHLKEWENECKLNKIPFRLNTKYGFNSFNELKNESEYYNHKVISIELDGNENVYNGTVDEFHNFYMGYFEEVNQYNKPKFLSVNSLQCGEIPLCPNDSCRLLAINLFGYVINPFTSNAEFDWQLFSNDVVEAQRYMDDIIDLEIEKIDSILAKIASDPEEDIIKIYEINVWNNIKKMTLNGRRTGLGITGEGDMLAALGLCYGTDIAIDFSENVHEVLKMNAYRSSVIMAKERGAFSIYNSEREINNPFIARIREKDENLYSNMIKYGRRNIALLTIAPTGSVSILTQTTSGIEPTFLTAYMRRRKINPQEKDIRIDFVDDEGVAWMEYPIFHHKFEMWLQINGYDINVVKTMNKEQLDEIIKKSPYYKATSNDIDWVKKVEMQGRLQKHIDHSISVTVNLPKETTEEIVEKVYEKGWSSGCKGLTVYRDGSRSGVLLNIEEKKDKKDELFVENHASKRPKRLKGEIHRFQNSLEKWIAVVGLKDGRPYEIFTGKLENGLSNLSQSIKTCEVVKNIIESDELDEKGDRIRIKRYDIEYIDSDGIKQIHSGLNHAFNPEFWNYAKLISGILRHGMPLVYVYELIHSLNFKEDYINTWKNGVERTIKRYIKDGETAKGKCPNCGGTENLRFVDGCLTCMDCGSSKCS